MKKKIGLILSIAILFNLIPAGLVFAEEVPAVEVIVTTSYELRDAVISGKSKIGISGILSLSENILINDDITLVGMDDNSGIQRAAGYTGSLLSFSGTSTENISVNLSNLIIDGANSTATCSAIIVEYAELSISKSFLINCSAQTDDDPIINGAAINIYHSNVDISDTVFEGNSIISSGRIGAGSGGAAYMFDCTLNINKCEFSGNGLYGYVRGNGMALCVEKGIYIVSNSSFIENISDGDAYGALYVSEGDNSEDKVDLTVDGCIFHKNSTQTFGGGLSTPYDWNDRNNRTITIKNTVFTENYADSEAGAILLGGATVTIDGTTVNYNESPYQGGGATFYASTVVITNSEFCYNSCIKGDSGAIHNWASIMEMTNVDLCYNTAGLEGGAMCLYCSEYLPENENGEIRPIPTSLTFNGGKISYNRTVGKDDVQSTYPFQSSGGGIFIHDDATFIFNDGIIEGNSSCMNGGGVFVDDQEWVETYSAYSYNEINHTYYGASGTFIMNGGIIRNNHAAISGGGVFVADEVGYDRIPIEYRDAAHFIMNGGTIRDNTAGENGGGVHIEYKETTCDFIMGENAFVFDNKASNDLSNAGDDIYDETNPEIAQKQVDDQYPYREYSDILDENCILTPIGNYAIPDNLAVPFVNWYIDGATDSEGLAHRFVDLQSPIPAEGMLNKTTGLKAIWGGYLLMYDANDGSGRTYLKEMAFYPGENAVAEDNMFPAKAGVSFIGWNMEPDGSGDWYYPGTSDNQIIMNANTVLYAQYQATATYGNLTVSKTVSGNAADATKAFSFTVTLSDTAISGTYGDVTFENGIATFTLIGGESKSIEGLPNGVSYTVEEADYTADGYVTTKTGDTGTIVGDETQSAAFTNTRNESPVDPPENPQTGDSNMGKWISILLISVVGMFACIGLGRRRRYRQV